MSKNNYLILGVNQLYYYTREDNDPRNNFKMQTFQMPSRTVFNLGIENRFKLLGQNVTAGVIVETLLGIGSEAINFKTIEAEGYLKPKCNVKLFF